MVDRLICRQFADVAEAKVYGVLVHENVDKEISIRDPISVEVCVWPLKTSAKTGWPSPLRPNAMTLSVLVHVVFWRGTKTGSWCHDVPWSEDWSCP